MNYPFIVMLTATGATNHLSGESNEQELHALAIGLSATPNVELAVVYRNEFYATQYKDGKQHKP